MKKKCKADRLDDLLDNLAEVRERCQMNETIASVIRLVLQYQGFDVTCYLATLSKAAEGEEDEMGEACHTMYKKECRISYRPRMTKANKM